MASAAQRLRHEDRRDTTVIGVSSATPAVGGAALLVGEANGFATDFTYATDASRVAVKTAGVVTSYALDAFYANAGTSPKQVFDVSGNLVWSPHNMNLQSENLLTSWLLNNVTAPTATFLKTDTANTTHRTIQSVAITGVIGETYTHSMVVSAAGYSKIGTTELSAPNTDVAFDLNAGTKLYQAAAGSGTITALGGGQYLITSTVVATAATARFYVYILPDSYTTGAVSGAWVADGVKGMNIFRQQTNRGPVPTAYLSTTTVARFGLAIDYDPVTHASNGLLCELAGTNLLLNNATLSTQSVTVTAVAHTLSFFGTGTITLSGTVTAGPLVGTGVSNRVSLTFTPTAGSLTCTVTGTVSRGQLETGTVATSPIPTFAATVTRALDGYFATPAAIGYSATAGSWWAYVSLNTLGSNPGIIGNNGSGAIPLFVHNSGGFGMQETGSLNKLGITVVGSPHKAACAFQSGDRAITADGLSIVTDAGATANHLAPASTIFFGSNGSGASINGYIRQNRYLPRRPTNPELVAQTT